LEQLAADIYQRQGPPPSTILTLALQSRAAGILIASVYTCCPQNGSEAAFLFSNPREFEIFIATDSQGHLLRSSESVVRALLHKLKQRDMKAKIEISLQSPIDAQIYMKGTPVSLKGLLWDELNDNVVAIGIAIFIAFLAHKYWPDYFHESIAGLVTLASFSLWEAYSASREARKQQVKWSSHE
jgi:hypothetical protein